MRGSYLGDKFTSGVLGKEFIHELRNEQERIAFEGYFREDKDANSELWRKIAPKQAADGRWFVVKTFRADDADAPDRSRELPYDLVPATKACDLWSVGALAFQLLGGESLVPCNRDDDCVNGDAMAALYDWDDEATRRRLGAIEDSAARDLLSRLLVPDAEQRLGYSLADALDHVFFDPSNADKQRELEKASVLDRVNSRPSQPFQLRAFERLYQSSSETKRELVAAIFAMLDEYLLARPCDTSEADGKAGWDTATMRDKKKFLEQYVWPLSMWRALEDLTLPVGARPGHECIIPLDDGEIKVTVPDGVEGGSIVKLPAQFERLRALAASKSKVIFAEMFDHRDDVVNNGGKAFPDVEFYGKNDQLGLAEVADALSAAVGHDETRRDRLDVKVLVPALHEFGKNTEQGFKESLIRLVKEAVSDAEVLENVEDLPNFPRETTLVSVAPVKRLERMQVRRRSRTIPMLA